jgi:hypothetical protein
MDKVDELVDEMLLGDYKKIKLVEQASDMVDVILDDCGKDHKKKKKAMKEEVSVSMNISALTAAGIVGLTAAAIANRVAYCKEKYKNDEPSKKRCIWLWVKKKKEKSKIKEVVNQIDHVPDESAEAEHDKIKDELSKDERQLDEVENALESEPKQDGDEQLAALEDEMSKEQETRTSESAVDLVKKAFKEVKEARRVPYPEMKEEKAI